MISIKLQFYLKPEESSSKIYTCLGSNKRCWRLQRKVQKDFRTLKDVKSCCKLEISNFLKEL